MGGIGHTHASCYKEDALSELVCVCDLNKTKADEAAEKFGVPAFYAVKEVLHAHPELDIIDVTTSGFENGSWHYEPVMQALDAGKHVLTENLFRTTSTKHARWCGLRHTKVSTSGVTSTTFSPVRRTRQGS